MKFSGSHSEKELKNLSMNYKSLNVLQGLIGFGIAQIILGINFVYGLFHPQKLPNFLKRSTTKK